MPADADNLDGEVSIAIRPEQLSFTEDANAAHLGGEIKHISYFGSGFDYEIGLDSGEIIMLQEPNRGAGHRGYQIGDAAHIAINDNSMQILAD